VVFKKKNIMKPALNNHEILLFTTTSFSKRQLCDKDPEDKNGPRSNTEQLEAACWNGLLEDVLREVISAPPGHKLFLWEVETEKSYLRLSMGETRPTFENSAALDPHIFLSEQPMN